MELLYKDKKYRSASVINGLSMAGPRAHFRGMGLVNEELAKPFIGVINTHNEMHPGHVHLDRLAGFVKDGVRTAGGVPFEVNTISICDGFAQGHVGMCSVLPSREVITDSIEVYANAHRLDGLVLIGGCDKIVPAMLMAALRVNIPTIIVTGGPMLPGEYNGKSYATY
ncbi:MAG: dihydroxy-acid dehydratase, partial [Angelakisella sp.]